MSVTIQNWVMNLLARIWPTTFGPQPEEPVERISLPPEPMFRDPVGGEWRPL